MKKRNFSGVIAFCLALIFSWNTFAARGESTVPPASPNPNGIAISRAVPAKYAPDTHIEVQITISAETAEGITAIGMREVVPEAWRYVSIRAITNELPFVIKQDPNTDILEMAWINPPQFPIIFAYTLQVPPPGLESNGTKYISGQVEYRTDSGRLVAPPLLTTLEGDDFLYPSINLYGDNPLILQRGDTYFEPGYTASDNGYDLPSTEVQLSGHLNTSIPGNYHFTYTIVDQAGNESSVVRVIIVEPKMCALLRAVCDFWGDFGF